MLNLDETKILTFDCYGTLIDWESGMLSGLQPLVRQAAVSLADDQVLEAHAFHESSQQRQTPYMRYSDLLAIVHRRLAEEWGVRTTWEDCVEYGRSVRQWPAFSDSVSTLRRLRKRFSLAILSNVDNVSFEHSRQRLGAEFDYVYTAEDIGSYKPKLRNFHYMLEKMARRGIAQRQILHVAESLFHDHAPANEVGLRNCWINRRSGQDGFGAAGRPESMPCIEFRFNSLESFADAALAN